MPPATLGDVMLYLRRACAAQHYRDLPDSQLLERFVAHQEDSAFSSLVKRHGPMVQAVGQRVLGDFHGAEDVFQATFLVLARRAGSIRKRDAVGSWLYGVAQRIAAKARAKAAIRRDRERQLRDMPHAEQLDDLTWQELRGVLDEEIVRLPEKCRTAIVLCYFESKSHEQAAKELGWPKRTLTNRVERGRELLRLQLVKRGFTLSAGVVATVMGEKVIGAPVGAMLTINTVKGAMAIAAGKAVAGGCFSAAAVALAEEALGGMLAIKGKMVALVLALGLAFGGAGLAGYGRFGEKEQPAQAVPPQSPLAKVEMRSPQRQEVPVGLDLYGDPLPEGAVARLGTVRFRHDFQVCQVAFTPDGKTLVSGGGTGIGIGIWDAATGRPLRRLPGLCNNLAVSPDGKLLFTENLRLIEVATGKEVRRFKAPGGAGIGCVAFSPDGKTLAAAAPYSDGLNVFLWDADEDKGSRTLEGHTDAVESIAFSPNGKTLASGSKDKTVRLWDVATGKEISRFQGNEKAVHSVSFAPGGNTIAAAGEDGVIRLWDIGTGKIVQLLSGDRQGINTIVRSIAFSPDGKLLASGGFAWPQDGICLWDLTTGKELRRCEPHNYWISSLAFSPDGKVLASVGGSDSTIHLWDPASGKEIDPARGHTSFVRSLQFSPGGQTLFSTSRFFDVKEWDIATGLQRPGLFAGQLGAVPGTPLIPDHGVLSPDAKVLALVGRFPAQDKSDPDIRLLDSRTGKELRTLKGHRDEVLALAYSPDGKLLASGGLDGIRLWDVETSKELHHVSNDVAWRMWFVFSPDGKLLASSGWDRTIYLWDTATGKEIRRWDSQQGKVVEDLAFSPDGKVIASASNGPNGGVRIWSTATGKELLRFGGRGEKKEEDRR